MFYCKKTNSQNKKFEIGNIAKKGVRIWWGVKMGRLAIRRVVYSGDKYSFESPYLNDGIVIMEGVNGHGKSTFMNLIYYGLGGRVQAFNKNDDND